MTDLDERAGAPRRRRPRRWTVLAVVAVVVLTGGGVLAWEATRPPKPVSVSEALNRFHKAQPSAPPTALPAAPATGVYVYATTGSERISAGVSHRYPARTTVTVSVAGCGLQVRWDALSGRWARAQLCPSGSGWRLTQYTDVHKFLYLEDVHSYDCRPPTVTADGWSVSCPTAGGLLTSTAHRLGTGTRVVAGTSQRATHVRIEQHATGRSLSTGTIDLWLLANGMPAYLHITDHGSQEVLGSRVTYDEHATFQLTSLTPLH